MRYIATILLVGLHFVSQSQAKGFEFLASSKASLESVIKVYANSIPDTCDTYKFFFLPLAKHYNKAKASYDGYRGAMKDCILNNENKNKIKHCLQSKSITIQQQLDSLDNILEKAYLDAYSKKTIKKPDIDYTGKNSGLFTGDFIKSLLDTLINGSLKLWDQSKKYKKEYKDTYLNNIADKQYDLAELSDLLRIKNTQSSTK